MATVTCHTSGCVKDGEPVPGIIHPRVVDDNGQETDELVDPWNVICGACGQPITDITEDG